MAEPTSPSIVSDEALARGKDILGPCTFGVVAAIRQQKEDEAFAVRVAATYKLRPSLSLVVPEFEAAKAALAVWPRGTQLLCCVARLDQRVAHEVAPTIAAIRATAGSLGISVAWLVGIEADCDALETADLHHHNGCIQVCERLSWQVKLAAVKDKEAALCARVEEKFLRNLEQGRKRPSVDAAPDLRQPLRTDWRLLTADVLAHTLTYLDRCTQVVASRTCAQWNVSVEQSHHVLHHGRSATATFASRHEFYGALHGSWCAAIGSISSSIALDEHAFRCLGLLPRLRTLSTHLNTTLPIDALVRMFDAPFVAKLESLTIKRYGAHRQPTSTWQNFLVGVLATRLPALTYLGLYLANEPGEVDLAPLAQLPRVTRLFCDVRGHVQSVRQVRALLAMPHLTRLDGYDQWDASTWHELTWQRRRLLTRVDMSRVILTAADLARLDRLPALEVLSVKLSSLVGPCVALNALAALHTLHLEVFPPSDHLQAAHIVSQLGLCVLLRDVSLSELSFSAGDLHQLLREHPLLITLAIACSCSMTWRTVVAPDHQPTVSPSLRSLTLYKCGALNLNETLQHLPAMLPALTSLSVPGSFSIDDRRRVAASLTLPMARWPSLTEARC
jgi:hypothetical protein